MATVNQFNREFVNTPVGFPITDSDAFPTNSNSEAAAVWLEIMAEKNKEDVPDD